jgi:hypothetical protein
LLSSSGDGSGWLSGPADSNGDSISATTGYSNSTGASTEDSNGDSIGTSTEDSNGDSNGDSANNNTSTYDNSGAIGLRLHQR